MNQPPTLPAYPQTRSGVETYIMPDGACFLYDPESDAGYTLDQLGALVWDYCDGETAVERIVQEIAELLPANDEARERVSALLTEFTQEGLLSNREAQAIPTTESALSDE